MNNRLPRFLPAFASLALLSCGVFKANAVETVPISSLDLHLVEQGWGKPQANLSVDGNPLMLGGKPYKNGLGTHAESMMMIALKKGATRFKAVVGVDDEMKDHPLASVEFEVHGDGKLLWKSGPMRARDAARSVDVDLKNVEILTLLVNTTGDGNDSDHADWADAVLEVNSGKPQAIAIPREAAVILTPKPTDTPRITSPKVFGVRPGSPFFFTVSATGLRPMEFSATGLPDGLSLDPVTGRITGTLKQAGEHRVTLHAKNSRGTSERALRIVAGDQIALTPPMGWNSWNCWAGAVDQDKVLRSARAMVSSGLAQHGWSYINIDDTWQGKRLPPSLAIQPNKKFPDMAGLCAEIHGMGLRAGIYSTPWVTSYAKFVGGTADNPEGTWSEQEKANGRHLGKFSFAVPDAKQFAKWGFDYLKYDWIPNDVPHVQEMSEALRASGRDIVYSLSNSAPFKHAADWARLANCWRTTGDINDGPGSMAGIGFSQERWAPYTGPGHWNDPDMLVVGWVGWGPKLHPTRLSPNEQYAHISLWCLLSAPLLIGCDLERLDDFTLGLLTNDEVLDVNQDPLGQPAKWISRQNDVEVISKQLEDGSLAVGLFNRSRSERHGVVKWKDLELSGPQVVRDLWRQKDLGAFDTQFEVAVPPRGVILVKIINK